MLWIFLISNAWEKGKRNNLKKKQLQKQKIITNFRKQLTKSLQPDISTRYEF